MRSIIIAVAAALTLASGADAARPSGGGGSGSAGSGEGIARRPALAHGIAPHCTKGKPWGHSCTAKGKVRHKT